MLLLQHHKSKRNFKFNYNLHGATYLIYHIKLAHHMYSS